MSNDCSKDSCSTGAASSSSCCSTESCSTDSACCGDDPVAASRALWCSSFSEALRQVHVEALKTRIVKAWGPQIDKGADAVIEAMGAVWASKIAQAKLKSDLATKMTGILFGGK